MPRVYRTILGRFQTSRKLLALWAAACACAGCDLQCTKVLATLSSRSNDCKRLADLPRVCRTILGRFQTVRKLLALWAAACACAGSDLRWAKVLGTLGSRSNVCKRFADLPRVCRTILGRFQTARKLLALWASACACAGSDLRWAKVLGTLSSQSNDSKRLAGLPRVCRTILGRFQTARKLLALWASACACAGSDLRWAKVLGLLSSRSNDCKRLAGLPRVFRTILGRFQTARKLLALWASACACAGSDLKCVKVLGTLGSRSNDCKRLAGLPRDYRTILGRFQTARKLLALWASACACAGSDLRWAKVLGTLSSQSNDSKRLAGLPRVCRTILGRFQTARKLLALWASACACAGSDLRWAKVLGTLISRSNDCKRLAGLPRVYRTILGRFQTARKLLALWASACACAGSDLRWAKVLGTLSSRSNDCKRLAGLPRVYRTILGRFQTARKLLALWASACACAGSDPRWAKVLGTLSSRSNDCKRLADLPRVCRTILGRFQTVRKLLALWAAACACAGSDLKCVKVLGTLGSRSNDCKRLAGLPRDYRTILGRFQTARKLLALWASACACAGSDLRWAKVLGTLSSQSNDSKRLAGLPRVCRTILGRFQTARKLLALWASACACAGSDLRWAKVLGLLSSRSNDCKRLAGLPRVYRTILGRFQTARKLLALWASACACAGSDLRWAKVLGTLSSRSNDCKRLADLPRVCRTILGRFQTARKLLALWASGCACAGSDLRWAKVLGLLSSRSNDCKRLAGLPRVYRTISGRFQTARKLLALWASACACAGSDLRWAKVLGTLISRSNDCKRLAGLPRVYRTILGRFQTARKLLALWASACACAGSDLKCVKVLGTLSSRSNDCK